MCNSVLSVELCTYVSNLQTPYLFVYVCMYVMRAHVFLSESLIRISQTTCLQWRSHRDLWTSRLLGLTRQEPPSGRRSYRFFWCWRALEPYRYWKSTFGESRAECMVVVVVDSHIIAAVYIYIYYQECGNISKGIPVYQCLRTCTSNRWVVGTIGHVSRYPSTRSASPLSR